MKILGEISAKGVAINNRGTLIVSGGAKVSTTSTYSKAINNIDNATAIIADTATISPEGAMSPQTAKPAVVSNTAIISVTTATYTLSSTPAPASHYVVYAATTGGTPSTAVTATVNGTTLTLSGATAGTYYIEAYDRAKGKGYSNTRLALTVTTDVAPPPSGGGGSSSGGSSRPTPEKPTEAVSGASNTTATVDSNGNAQASVTDKNIAAALKEAKDAATKKGVNAGEITAIINVTTGGNRPAFDLKANSTGGIKSITNFGSGTANISIPYTLQKGEIAEGLYAVYVDDNGKVSHITDSVYDSKAKVLRFNTNHFSVYGVGYKAPMGFIDIANHWAKTDIEFVADRGLMSGVSDTVFQPDGAMTRGMSATTFDPDRAITRQEMAVIMQSYAVAMGYTVPKTGEVVSFADSGSIADWAA